LSLTALQRTKNVVAKTQNEKGAPLCAPFSLTDAHRPKPEDHSLKVLPQPRNPLSSLSYSNTIYVFDPRAFSDEVDTGSA